MPQVGYRSKLGPASPNAKAAPNSVPGKNAVLIEHSLVLLSNDAGGMKPLTVPSTTGPLAFSHTVPEKT